MNWNRYLLALLAVGALLAGCADGGDSAGVEPTVPAPVEPSAAGSGPTDPVALIGSWTVAGVEGETGAILRLAPTDVRLFDRCGVRSGSWRADANGLFVAHLYGSSASGPGCGNGAEQIPGWLARAVGFRPDGRNRILVDDQGGQVARLLPGAKPTAGPNLAPSEVEPPVVTDEVRRSFAPAVGLPEPLVPAGRDALIGRWVPVGDRTAKAYVELHADGRWNGSDGCNGHGGRWVAGPAGALLGTSGVSTLIGCDNVPVGSWLGSAWRAGLHGEVLVLLDARGTEIGRLSRA